MAGLSDFKRGQIVVVRMIGACTIKTVQMFDISRSTVSKIMIALEKEKKNVSIKHKSGQKPMLSEKDRQILL